MFFINFFRFLNPFSVPLLIQSFVIISAMLFMIRHIIHINIKNNLSLSFLNINHKQNFKSKLNIIY